MGQNRLRQRAANSISNLRFRISDLFVSENPNSEFRNPKSFNLPAAAGGSDLSANLYFPQPV